MGFECGETVPTCPGTELHKLARSRIVLFFHSISCQLPVLHGLLGQGHDPPPVSKRCQWLQGRTNQLKMAQIDQIMFTSCL